MDRQPTKFKDIVGNTIHIGDSVVYSQGHQGSSWLNRGVITRETPQKLGVQPLEYKTVWDRDYPGFKRPTGEPEPTKMLGPWGKECTNIVRVPDWDDRSEFL
jgi:hypothetical protein